MIPFVTKQTQRTIVMCAIDWPLIGMKQFLYVFHQPSEKRIDIHCKVTFSFKYIHSQLKFIPTLLSQFVAICW